MAAVLASLVMLAPLTATAARAGRARGGATVGPAQISPLHHAGLCWEAWGNGSAVTLKPCDSALQGQQWTFTANHVVMNGNGYCLQAAPGASSLFLSFSGQCAGLPDQEWIFDGATNSITNPHTGRCAVAIGGLRAGTGIASGPCNGARDLAAWSFGSSRLSLSGSSAGPGGPGQGAARAGTGRAFAAEVTVSNATAAMTAYGASVWIRPPGGLRVTRLAGTGALSGWTCTLKALSCGGTLPPGERGQISVGGTVLPQAHQPARITAQAAVTHTNQAGHLVGPAVVPVRIFSLAPAVQKAGAAAGRQANAVARFGFGVAIALMIAGTLLAVITRRRQHSSRPPAR